MAQRHMQQTMQNVYYYVGVSVAEWLCVAGLRRRRARVKIAVATQSGNSLRQTAHTHCASVHQAAKLVAAFLRVGGGNCRPG